MWPRCRATTGTRSTTCEARREIPIIASLLRFLWPWLSLLLHKVSEEVLALRPLRPLRLRQRRTHHLREGNRASGVGGQQLSPPRTEQGENSWQLRGEPIRTLSRPRARGNIAVSPRETALRRERGLDSRENMQVSTSNRSSIRSSTSSTRSSDKSSDKSSTRSSTSIILTLDSCENMQAPPRVQPPFANSKQMPVGRLAARASRVRRP